jgi:hypothetical protein
MDFTRQRKKFKEQKAAPYEQREKAFMEQRNALDAQRGTFIKRLGDFNKRNREKITNLIRDMDATGLNQVMKIGGKQITILDLAEKNIKDLGKLRDISIDEKNAWETLRNELMGKGTKTSAQLAEEAAVAPG